MRSAYATFLRNVKVNLRAYPWSFFIGGLISALVSVALAYLMYHLLAGGRLGAEFTQYAGTADYMSYVILGASAFGFSVSVLLGVSRSLIGERREGTLESLLLAPAGRVSYFAGVTTQFTLASLGETVVLLLIAWPLGLRLGQVNLGALALAIPVTLLCVFGMALTLGAIMLASGDTYISQNTLFVAMALLCGFTFPPNYLPLPLQWLGAALPISGALRLLRAALLEGASVAAVAPEAAVYALLGLAYVALGLWLLRWAERRALEGVS